MADLPSRFDGISKEAAGPPAVVLDASEVARKLAHTLASRFATSVDAALKSHEEHSLSRSIEAVEKAATVLDRSAATISRVEAMTAKAQRILTWRALGKMVASLTPMAVALAVMGWLLLGFSMIAGVGPITDWLWSAFSAAESGWGKALLWVSGWVVLSGLGWVLAKIAKAVWGAAK